MTDPPAALRRELQDGERVLWHGRPDPFHKPWGLILVSLFGLLLLLLMTFAPGAGPITINDVPVHDPLAREAIRLFFHLVVGAIMLAAPATMLVASRIRYAVTDRRLLVVTSLPWLGRVKTIPPARLWGTERPDKDAEDAVGRLLILRRRPQRAQADTSDTVTEFLSIRDDAGAQEAAHAMIAAPAPLGRASWTAAPASGDAAAVVSARLRPGERLLWAARPDPARHAWAALVPSLLIMLFLSPVMIAVAAGDLHDPLLVVYVLILVTWPAIAWIRARWIAYGVTTERVMRLDATPLLGGERIWPRASIETIERTLPGQAPGSLRLRDGGTLTEEDQPIALVLHAVPDVTAAEAALFAMLSGPAPRA